MKIKNTQIALLLMAVFMLTFAACKKKDIIPDLQEETSPSNSVTPAYSYKASDANAVFAAVNAVTYQNIPVIGLQKIDINTALAVFFSSPGNKPYVDGGAASCETKVLTKDTSNVYLFAPSGSETITFSGNTDWAIAGNSITGMPTKNFTSSTPVPVYNGISNGTLTGTVNRASDITITLGGGAITNADSVFVTISSGSSFLQKVVAANSNCTFTAAQLGTLNSTNGAANGIIQVAPFKIESTITSGKKYYFVNEAAYTKFVTVE